MPYTKTIIKISQYYLIALLIPGGKSVAFSIISLFSENQSILKDKPSSNPTKGLYPNVFFAKLIEAISLSLVSHFLTDLYLMIFSLPNRLSIFLLTSIIFVYRPDAKLKDLPDV